MNRVLMFAVRNHKCKEHVKDNILIIFEIVLLLEEQRQKKSAFIQWSCMISKQITFLLADNEGSIPSQFPVQEDTQFCQILRESLDYFGIPEKLHDEHFLVDFKTRKLYYLYNKNYKKIAIRGCL